MKNKNDMEKEIKAVQKISKEYSDKSDAINLIDDYSKLINALDNKSNSSTYQIKVVNKFFKKHPNANINKLSLSTRVKYAWDIDGMYFESHPLLEVIDCDECKHKVSKSRVRVLEALLKNNVSPDLSDTDFIEPLSGAVKTKDCVVAKLLLKHGANPNCVGDNDIPVLFTAAANLDKEMVKILLDHKGDVNIKNKYNGSYPKLKNHNVLAYMFRSNSGETQDQVYKYESDFKANAKNTVEMVKYLKKRGVSLQAKLGYKNKTLKQLVEGLSEDSHDAYGNNWGGMIKDLNKKMN